ncbi:MAG: hypothetical protein J5892_02815 [Bacilli bacterium]|nr:hypothetical protein [Bacilli bacterium]
MKKLLIVILIASGLTYLIYTNNKQERINILSIGDIYSNGFNNGYYPSYNDYLMSDLKYDQYDIKIFHHTSELINELNNHDSDIKKLIKEANVIFLNIGIEQLVNQEYINSNYISEYLDNYEIIIKEITNLNKHLYLINLPSNINIDKKYIVITNTYLKGLSEKYHLALIDISNNKIESINQEIYQQLFTANLTN